MGFSNDQRPDVNSGYFILLQYKPSTLLEYLFYWTAERPSLHGAWHEWIPCEVVRVTASELSGWLPCFRCLAVMWSGWLLPSYQADCLTPGWSNGVRFTLHSHPHLSSCTCVTAHGTGYANRPVGRYTCYNYWVVWHVFIIYKSRKIITSNLEHALGPLLRESIDPRRRSIPFTQRK